MPYVYTKGLPRREPTSMFTRARVRCAHKYFSPIRSLLPDVLESPHGRGSHLRHQIDWPNRSGLMASQSPAQRRILSHSSDGHSALRDPKTFTTWPRSLLGDCPAWLYASLLHTSPPPDSCDTASLNSPLPRAITVGTLR